MWPLTRLACYFLNNLRLWIPARKVLQRVGRDVIVSQRAHASLGQHEDVLAIIAEAEVPVRLKSPDAKAHTLTERA